MLIETGPLTPPHIRRLIDSQGASTTKVVPLPPPTSTLYLWLHDVAPKWFPKGRNPRPLRFSDGGAFWADAWEDRDTWRTSYGYSRPNN